MVGASDDSSAVEASTLTVTSAGNSAEMEDVVTILRWVTPELTHITPLLAESVILGRESAGAARLERPGVSRRHAELRPGRTHFLVRDLASKNGIFVNGVRTQETPLAPGDVLRVGDCVAVVERVPVSGFPGPSDLGYQIFGGWALRQRVKEAKRIAGTMLNVVLQGETGTGKERFARAIHAHSGRPGRFVAVNSAAYSEATMVGELFGYRKGAFTGADRASLGHVRAAHEGNLFLDEILELPPELQSKLLRVIEAREVLPLGETEPCPCDVRFIAATQRPLADAVAAGVFRADLRSRLEGVVIELPPLRARRGDIVPLFRVLLERHGAALPRLAPELVEHLTVYSWPMNVRELENVARRLIALHPGVPTFKLEHVAGWLAAESTGERSGGQPAKAALVAERLVPSPYSDEERLALDAALARHAGNVTRAAAELGMTRPKAYRMLRSDQRSHKKGPKRG